MQTPVVTTAGTTHEKWYKTRTIISGLFLVGLAVLYFVVVLPVANAEIPVANYRFPFSFITLIYAVDLTVLGIEFLYRLYRPAKPAAPQGHTGKADILGMILRTGFLTVLGGSYVTGAAVATPTAFSVPPITTLAGLSIPIYANSLHSLFASLIIAFGAAIVVFEIVKIVLHKGTWRNWLVKGRYPEIKILYWIIGISVIVQGIFGLYLLGTISSIGPFGLVGNNGYDFETLIRHLHGPLGALIFAVFSNHIYYRLRPEWHIR